MSEHEWLSALIQTYAHGEKMTVLELSNAQYGTGVLGVGRQRVLYARSGSYTGEEAFRYIMRWGAGALDAHHDMEVTPNIDRTLASLLLAALRHARDNGPLHIEDVHDTLESWPPEPCRCDDLRRWNALSEWSRSHLACEELLGIEIFDPKGSCVRRYEGEALDRMPCGPAALSTMIAEFEVLGACWELMFSYEDAHHIVVPLEEQSASLHLAFDAAKLSLGSARGFVERTLRAPGTQASLRRASRRRSCLCYSSPDLYGWLSGA